MKTHDGDVGRGACARAGIEAPALGDEPIVQSSAWHGRSIIYNSQENHPITPVQIRLFSSLQALEKKSISFQPYLKPVQVGDGIALEDHKEVFSFCEQMSRHFDEEVTPGNLVASLEKICNRYMISDKQLENFKTDKSLNRSQAQFIAVQRLMQRQVKAQTILNIDKKIVQEAEIFARQVINQRAALETITQEGGTLDSSTLYRRLIGSGAESARLIIDPHSGHVIIQGAIDDVVGQGDGKAAVLGYELFEGKEVVIIKPKGNIAILPQFFENPSTQTLNDHNLTFDRKNSLYSEAVVSEEDVDLSSRSSRTPSVAESEVESEDFSFSLPEAGFSSLFTRLHASSTQEDLAFQGSLEERTPVPAPIELQTEASDVKHSFIGKQETAEIKIGISAGSEFVDGDAVVSQVFSKFFSQAFQDDQSSHATASHTSYPKHLSEMEEAMLAHSGEIATSLTLHTAEINSKFSGQTESFNADFEDRDLFGEKMNFPNASSLSPSLREKTNETMVLGQETDIKKVDSQESKVSLSTSSDYKFPDKKPKSKIKPLDYFESRHLARRSYPRAQELEIERVLSGGPGIMTLLFNDPTTGESIQPKAINLEQMMSQMDPHNLDQPKLLNLVVGAAEGLEYMHGNNFVHRDIKPNNLFEVGSKGAISDFEVACRVDEIALQDCQSTIDYSAPEMVARQYYGRKEASLTQAVDIWAFGMVLRGIMGHKPENFKLFQDCQHEAKKMLRLISLGAGELKPPLDSPSVEKKDQYEKMLEESRLAREKYERDYPKPADGTLEHLAWRCLRVSPSERPTATEVKQELQKLLARAQKSFN